MRKYNFDQATERRGTDCAKWDGLEAAFPDYHLRKDTLPMWVADMDFPAPAEVVEALVARAATGIYGYTNGKTDGFDRAVQNWLSRRHGLDVKAEWIVPTSGVVPAINYAVQAFTKEGDGILYQPPVYYPFRSSIRNNDRKTVENPLVIRDGRYEIDFEDLQRKAADDSVKMMIFCNPHNPVGRVWSEEDVRRVTEICEANGVLLFSDEIHSDLIMPGHRHIPAAAVSTRNLIAACAPSKTFNLAGIQVSALVIPDESLRGRFQEQVNRNAAGGMNVFSCVALEAAYQHGEDFLQELLDYLDGNRRLVRDALAERLPEAKVYVPEGTYLIWIDLNGTGFEEEEIYRRLLEEAGVAGDLGHWFGEQGRGYVRLNLATQRSRVEEAVQRIAEAFVKRSK